MNNKVYAEVLKLAENAGLQVKKVSDDANIMGTIDDAGTLQQCAKVVPQGEDAVAVRAFTNYLSDTGMAISKDWNDTKEHVYKKADDAYNYLITSGVFNDQD
ncbi:hypothetical protein BGL38_02690 [Fructilactobacillus sanfranciscensis]|uniref:hypothetical protein n=1 Tax=Fructilactobacillus sanfranciscensis TaxID=1625 RepID=UPI000CD3C854|nr:hypothetical protein [Fructilactobacillus sanfranciscensis]MCG7194377.1 hypothetical protein [Fructilactobacillus sanfranciscensis]NDR97478.1 hypothetical protein [Fructilactobacillus sanfranciscensis]POH09762.1 hypothetical protein BGL37_03120 [Fructilactobacillus sanfranciscensis]POH10133.1 hypothetical protein BGL38_02690 [Fructilactobacillus sanfranciscensis]POH10538.1 hypothetical protein BGL39_03025 [Fructilactobacillus sanfranciscensis]